MSFLVLVPLRHYHILFPLFVLQENVKIIQELSHTYPERIVKERL